MILYGGSHGQSTLSDINTLDLDGTGTWSPLTPVIGTDPVPPRRDQLAVYDSQSHRMIVFGGSSNSGASGTVGDVWSLTLGASPAWSKLNIVPNFPDGGNPSARLSLGGIYDPLRNRLVIFGGAIASGAFVDETWTLSLGALTSWTHISPVGPAPEARSRMSAAYDPVGDRMLVFGGQGESYLNDVWALPLAQANQWEKIEPLGPGPSIRRDAAAMFDPVRNRLIVMGGYNGTYLDDTWALDLSGTPTWSRIGVGGFIPTPRFGHRAVYDAVGDRMVVYGGLGRVNNHSDYLEDTIALPLGSGGTWTVVAARPEQTEPSALNNHVAIFDAAGDQMVVFGGNSPSGLTSATWALHFSDPPAWSAILTATQPAARYGHAGAFDTQRRRLLVFGGHDDQYYTNETWALSLAYPPHWTNLSPPSGPSPEPRGASAAVYDPVGDRLLVFGGFGRFTGTKGDLWALPLGVPAPQWTELFPTGAGPVARRNCAAVYDAAHQRVILQGGIGSEDFDDTWALDLNAPGDGAWVVLDEGSPYSAPARHGHAAVLDQSGRFVLFGGQSVGLVRDDLWSAGPGAFAFWNSITPEPPAQRPDARDYFSLAFDPGRNRAILFGGQDESGAAITDPWFLQLDSGSVVGVPGNSGGAVRLALARVAPNPIRGAFNVHFSLAHAGGGSLGLYDVRGRALLTRDLSALPAGEHRVQLEAPAGTASGMYFVALSQDGMVRRAKVALLK